MLKEYMLDIDTLIVLMLNLYIRLDMENLILNFLLQKIQNQIKKILKNKNSKYQVIFSKVNIRKNG